MLLFNWKPGRKLRNILTEGRRSQRDTFLDPSELQGHNRPLFLPRSDSTSSSTAGVALILSFIFASGIIFCTTVSHITSLTPLALPNWSRRSDTSASRDVTRDCRDIEVPPAVMEVDWTKNVWSRINSGDVGVYDIGFSIGDLGVLAMVRNVSSCETDPILNGQQHRYFMSLSALRIPHSVEWQNRSNRDWIHTVGCTPKV